MGQIDGSNSSTFPLGAGDSFGGSFVSTIDYNEIQVSVETDTSYQLVIDFSSNGTDIGKQELITQPYIVATSKSYSFKPYMQFYSVNLINTSVSAQTSLNIASILKNNGVNVQLNNLRDFQIFDSSAPAGTSILINGGNYPRQYTFLVHYLVQLI